MHNVAVQIEPHGRLKVVAGQIHATGAAMTEGSKVLVRLDGIVYHLFMPFNAPPPTCAPNCFTDQTDRNGMRSNMGCQKYCTP